jgi:endonuclease-3
LRLVNINIIFSSSDLRQVPGRKPTTASATEKNNGRNAAIRSAQGIKVEPNRADQKVSVSTVVSSSSNANTATGGNEELSASGHANAATAIKIEGSLNSVPDSDALEGQIESKQKMSIKKKPISKAPVPKELAKDTTSDDTVKKAKWEPKDWQQVLENIKVMRAVKDAPVDTMGCERTMEENVAPKVSTAYF